MPSLEAQIDQDLKESMKAHDAVRTSTLRLLKSSLHAAAIDQRVECLADADALAILGRQIKQRREAIDAYRQGGRADLVAKEEAELAILLRYEPPQLTTEELATLVQKAVATVGATGPADQGKVMKQLMPHVQGRADGKRVSQMVVERLGRTA